MTDEQTTATAVDEHLWQAPGVSYGSVKETIRVRMLLLEEVDRRLTAGTATSSSEARGQLSQEWVNLAEKEGQKVPGIPLRSELQPGETLNHRKRDAAGRAIRHLWEGAQAAEWELVGIEATICNARGMALPGKWYEQQQRLL